MQCFFDTPGLTLTCKGYPYRDVKSRVESAWGSVNLYEVIIVLFDVHRHLTRLVYYYLNWPLRINLSLHFIFNFFLFFVLKLSK